MIERIPNNLLRVAALCALLAFPRSGSAQAIGSPAEDRRRLDDLLGPFPQQAATPAKNAFTFGIVLPDLRIVYNSAIPYSINEGSLWAGRGLNASVSTGVSATYESGQFGAGIVLAPTFYYSQNLPFDIVPGRNPDRLAFSSPWHTDPVTGLADLPLRFGDEPLRGVYTGESTVYARARNVAFGLTSASEWWGPGIRNALILSNNAPGIPRAFIRSAKPVVTPFGEFSGEFVAGTLTKSLFFDTLRTSDYRSFSGLTLTYRPPGSHLTLGLARAVYEPTTAAIPTLGGSLSALQANPGVGPFLADQISSLFGRWALPEGHFEVYGEFARMVLPRSLSDLLETPFRTAGFTVGFQWALPRVINTSTWRIQAEATSLDQNIVNPNDPPADFYTGRIAPQGYTQRGQIIGAAIGPGGSGEWIAADYLTPRDQIGVFVGRTRWEDNAMYRQPTSTFFSHDVSIYSGIRGGYRFPLVDLSVDLTVARRLNYLFQNGFVNPDGIRTVSVQNVTLGTRLTPR